MERSRAAHAVEQRGLAGVGAPHDGDAHVVVGVVLLEARQDRHQVVEQVAHAVALRRGDGQRVAQAQRVELVGGYVLADRVALVHGEEHRPLRAPQDAGDGLVLLGDAGLGVHDEHDGVGLVDGHDRLLADLWREHVVGRGGLDAARVDQGEVDAVPGGVVGGAVARDALDLVHDGLGALGDAVHEGGLAHVGATHHSNNWLCHESPLKSVEHTGAPESADRRQDTTCACRRWPCGLVGTTSAQHLPATRAGRRPPRRCGRAARAARWKPPGPPAPRATRSRPEARGRPCRRA